MRPLSWTLKDNLLREDDLRLVGPLPWSWPDLPSNAIEFLGRHYQPRSEIREKAWRWLHRPGVAQAIFGCGANEYCAEVAHHALLDRRGSAHGRSVIAPNIAHEKGRTATHAYSGGVV